MPLLTRPQFHIRRDYEEQIPAAVLLATERFIGDSQPLAVLFLPFDPGPHTTNYRERKHWAVRMKDDCQPAQLAALAAYRGADDPQLHEPVTVTVLVCGGAPFDDDGAYGALKPARDLLCRKDSTGRQRLLPDDTQAWWRYGGLEQIANRRLFPRTWTVLVVRRRDVGQADRI